MCIRDRVSDSPTLDLLGRCRTDGCQVAAGGQGQLPVQLHLINGDVLNSRLRDPAGLLMKAVAEHKSSDAIVEEFYLRCYSRTPNTGERIFWKREFAVSEERADLSKLAQDFLWALLSSEEFRTNR